MNNALKKSIALHLAVFLMFIIDLPMFWRNRLTMDQVPIIVDLKDVKISEVTNLPPKAKFGDEDKAATRTKPKRKSRNTAKSNPTKRKSNHRTKRRKRQNRKKNKLPRSQKKITWQRRSLKSPKRPKNRLPRKLCRPRPNPSQNRNPNLLPRRKTTVSRNWQTR